MVRINPTQNVATVSTPRVETADLIRKITNIRVAGNDYAFFAYVAAPDDSAKGVIHGIGPGTTPAELEAHLRAPGHTTLYAKMLGQTQSAVIIFEGKRIPHYVHYNGAQTRCAPYRLS